MTTAEIINRLFKVYPWAVLEFVSNGLFEVTIGCRFYRVKNVDERPTIVLEENRESGNLIDDQSHANHLRDVLLGKKRDDAGNVA